MIINHVHDDQHSDDDQHSYQEALRSSRLSSSVDSCQVSILTITIGITKTVPMLIIKSDHQMMMISQEGHFLSVPQQPITASSSAETLTDNTITAPGTPTLQPTTPTILPYHKEIRWEVKGLRGEWYIYIGMCINWSYQQNKFFKMKKTFNI